MMTKEELIKWCNDHVKMKSRLVYNMDNGYKIAYENGDTYEFKIMEYSINRKVYHFFVNGVLANETIRT